MSAGAFDPSFSTDGKAAVTIPGGVAVNARAVAVQADGKTVSVGSLDFTNAAGSTVARRFAIARYNFDGTPDVTFGPNHDGTVLVSVGEWDVATAQGVAVQADGRIVVVGRARMGSDASDNAFGVVRLLPNGALDTTFDGDGRRTINFDGEATDVAIQRDGKIVVVGTNYDFGVTSGDTNFAVARLKTNGSLDTTFDGDGKKQIGFGGNDYASAVSIEPFGDAIFVAGHINTGVVRKFAVTKLRGSDGSKDTSFGPFNDGTVATAFPERPDSIATDVWAEQSGNIVVAGRAGHETFANGYDFAIARYLPNGQLDTTFGPEQDGTVEIGFGGDDQAFGVYQNSEQGYALAGATNGRIALASLTAAGTLDGETWPGGRVVTDLPATTDRHGDVFGGMTQGPGYRVTVASGGGLQTARFLNEGANYVNVLKSDTLATEGTTTDTATFFVRRSELLPVPTRVFFSVGGTAARPAAGQSSGPDYALTGLTLPGTSRNPPRAPGGLEPVAEPGGTPYVDIPAGQMFTTVTLTAVDNAVLEPAETATFTIVPSSRYVLSTDDPSSVSVKLDVADNDAVRVNFQAAGAPPANYFPDVGRSFADRGSGLSFGWDADNTANARTRNNPGSPDARFDTLALMQPGGANRRWELAVPNGTYEVTLVAGDPSFTDSVYRLDLEGAPAVSGTPGGNTRWFKRTLNVPVSDGRLTLSNGGGALNNKVAFIDVRAARPNAVAGPVTPVESVNLLATVGLAGPVAR